MNGTALSAASKAGIRRMAGRLAVGRTRAVDRAESQRGSVWMMNRIHGTADGAPSSLFASLSRAPP